MIPNKKEKRKEGPRLILVRKLGKFDQIRKVGMGLGQLGKFIWKIRKLHLED